MTEPSTKTYKFHMDWGFWLPHTLVVFVFALKLILDFWSDVRKHDSIDLGAVAVVVGVVLFLLLMVLGALRDWRYSRKVLVELSSAGVARVDKDKGREFMGWEEIGDIDGALLRKWVRFKDRNGTKVLRFSSELKEYGDFMGGVVKKLVEREEPAPLPILFGSLPVRGRTYWVWPFALLTGFSVWKCYLLYPLRAENDFFPWLVAICVALACLTFMIYWICLNQFLALEIRREGPILHSLKGKKTYLWRDFAFAIWQPSWEAIKVFGADGKESRVWLPRKVIDKAALEFLRQVKKCAGGQWTDIGANESGSKVIRDS